jgi:hypothetical protein
MATFERVTIQVFGSLCFASHIAALCEARTVTEHTFQQFRTVAHSINAIFVRMWVLLHASENHALMTTDVSGEIINVTVNETTYGISHNGLGIEWSFVRSTQGQIQAGCIVAQQGEKVVRCRIGQAMGGDKLVQLFVKLRNSCRILFVMTIERFTGVSRRRTLNKAIDLAHNCLHERMVQIILLKF